PRAPTGQSLHASFAGPLPTIGRTPSHRGTAHVPPAPDRERLTICPGRAPVRLQRWFLPAAAAWLARFAFALRQAPEHRGRVARMNAIYRLQMPAAGRRSVYVQAPLAAGRSPPAQAALDR